MLAFFRELHVPGLVAAILVIVWSTAQMSPMDEHVYYPPANPALFHSITRPPLHELDAGELIVNLPIEPDS